MARSRTMLYVGMLLVAILSVCIRIGFVRINRSRPIVGFSSEWSKYGKPVTVKDIAARDVPVYAKFTVITASATTAAGFVTGDIKRELREGQEVYLSDEAIPCGRISKLGEELDISTGMFPVEVELESPAGASGSTLVVFARTQTLPGVLAVPNSILDISQDGCFLWKIESGIAKRTRVKTGSRNGYGTIIKEGIQDGDLIVFNGRSGLRENDKVNVIGEATGRQIDDEVNVR